MNEVYRRYFAKPYPNRATVLVAGLMVPGAVIEIVAYAHLKRALNACGSSSSVRASSARPRPTTWPGTATRSRSSTARQARGRGRATPTARC